MTEILFSNEKMMLLWVTSLFLVSSLFLIFSKIFRRNCLKVREIKRKFVLITGCDCGLGRKLAVQVVSRRIPVIACCLTENGAKSLHNELIIGEKWTNLWTPIFDVTNDESAERTKKIVSEITGKAGLWSLVCNAGVLGSPAPDDWLSTSDYEKTISVNLLGTIRSCQTFKSQLKIAKGRIVVVSSCLGQAVMPYTGPYTVSKFAVEGYADTIRNELSPFGVTVHTIIPGYYSTNLTNGHSIDDLITKSWNRASEDAKVSYGVEYFRNYKSAITSSITSLSAKDCSPVMEAFLHSITARHPYRKYRIGKDAFGILILSLVPAWLQDLFNRLFWKYYIGVPSVKRNNGGKMQSDGRCDG